MKNKLLYIVSLSFILLASNVVAQRGQGGASMEERKERLESMKISFLTEQLDLTPDEAKVFWPVYDSTRASWKNFARSVGKTW
jgi:hypothetical protein